MILASTGQSSPFLSSLPAFGRTLTPQLDIKHFLPLRINGGSPLSLFPNFNTMDPVQKAVINHTFGIPPPLKKKQYISCHVCHLRFNSANQAEAHFKGHKHARKLKATEGSKHKQKNSTASRNNSAAKSLPMLNGAVSTNLNNTRAKHRLTLEGQNNHIKRRHGRVLSKTGRKTKRIGNKGSRSIQNKAFQCEICEIYVNSETQLKQHMNSRRHKDRLAGKPPKPKYSPYNKLHQRAALTSKLILQKQLTKTLATGFLPNPLTTAALCAIPGPFTLRTATTTLFQTPIFGPTLFRATTGPFRASHTPVIFAPY